MKRTVDVFEVTRLFSHDGEIISLIGKVYGRPPVMPRSVKERIALVPLERENGKEEVEAVLIAVTSRNIGQAEVSFALNDVIEAGLATITPIES